MKKRIGAKVKHLRQEKLMTQSELAGDKITRSMLSLIEHGNSEPSLSSLAYLADRLHVSPAFLVASDDEDAMYRRNAKIGDIRIAYGAGEYRICLDLCRALGLPGDDELNLLSAECAVALAVEEIAEGKLHAVADHLEAAVEYAEKTRYSAVRIYAEAAVLSAYLGRFSDTFYSDIGETAERKGVPLSAAAGDPFCAYALLLAEIDGADGETDGLRFRIAPSLSALRIAAPLLASHVEELLLMREGRMSDALSAIRTIFGTGEHLPIPMLYELFRDREICARETGDYKGAYESASAKHEFLSRILSEP